MHLLSSFHRLYLGDSVLPAVLHENGVGTAVSQRLVPSAECDEKQMMAQEQDGLHAVKILILSTLGVSSHDLVAELMRCCMTARKNTASTATTQLSESHSIVIAHHPASQCADEGYIASITLRACRFSTFCRCLQWAFPGQLCGAATGSIMLCHFLCQRLSLVSRTLPFRLLMLCCVPSEGCPRLLLQNWLRAICSNRAFALITVRQPTGLLLC